jgi:ApeA N-terminal domain 1
VIETHTFRGLWWLPTAPDEKHEGNLTITKGAATLDLLGHFGRQLISEGERERVYSIWLADQERVLGLTTDGQEITLVDCTQGSGGGMHIPGIENGVYHARAVIVGHMFHATDTINFDEVEIRTAELENWVGIIPFPVTLNPARNAGTLTFERPPRMEFSLPSGETALLRFEVHGTGLGIVTTETTLRYAAWLGLRFPQKQSLEEAARAVWRLRNFLSLAVGKALAVLAVDAYRDDVVDRAGRRLTLHIFYALARNPEPAPRGVEPRELLFDLQQARDRLADVLSRWLSHQDRYEPVFELYFGTLYNPGSYREQRFIAYAQAIETYDRLKRPKAKERDPAEHKELIGEILKAVPETLRAWLKEKLAWSNDLPLARRIEYVLSGCPNITTRIVGDEGIEAFVKAVKDTRNYYTHYDPKLKAKAATEPRDMHRLTVQLRAVLETAFLLDIGFTCEEIETSLQRARRFEEIDLQR